MTLQKTLQMISMDPKIIQRHFLDPNNDVLCDAPVRPSLKNEFHLTTKHHTRKSAGLRPRFSAHGNSTIWRYKN